MEYNILDHQVPEVVKRTWLRCLWHKGWYKIESSCSKKWLPELPGKYIDVGRTQSFLISFEDNGLKIYLRIAKKKNAKKPQSIYVKWTLKHVHESTKLHNPNILREQIYSCCWLFRNSVQVAWPCWHWSSLSLNCFEDSSLVESIGVEGSCRHTELGIH